MFRRMLLLSFLNSLWITCVAQTLEGTVKSETSGEPVAGVNVRNLVTMVTVTTNSNGAFVLAYTNETDSVELTHINYRTRRLTVLDYGLAGGTISLSNATGDMEEVVVYNTGYDRLSKKLATGSYEKLDKEALMRNPSVNFLDRLNGMTTGMMFDRRYGIPTIRGISSLTSSVISPLIILDNFPYEGNLQNINPNDIESITILRDAAATAIWGAKAGNGVIVVTTKRGSPNQKPTISFSSNVSVALKDRLEKNQQFLESNLFIEYEQFLFNNGYYNSRLNNRTNYPVISPVVEVLNNMRNGSITTSDGESILSALAEQDIRKDLDNYVYRNGITSQQSLSLAGGSGKVGYSFFVSHDKVKAKMIGEENVRTVLKSNVIFITSRKVETTLGITLTQSKSSNVAVAAPISAGGTNSIYPYARLIDAQGQPAKIVRDFRSTYLDSTGGGLLLDWSFSPLLDAAENRISSKNDHFLIQAGVKYKWTNHINTEVRYQSELNHGNTENYSSPESFYSRNLINLYSQIQGNNVIRPIPLGGIRDQAQSNFQSHSARIQTTASYVLGNDHEMTAIAGFEARQTKATSSTTRVYGFDREILTYSNVNFNQTFPSYQNLRGSAFIPNNLNFAGTLDRFVSIYLSSNYAYRSKYLASGSIRRDASNLFGVSTNNRWKPLYSVGFGWNAHEERFLSEVVKGTLKFRYSFGYSGNVNNSIASIVTLELRNPASNFVTGLPFANIANRPNSTLRWETVRTSNFGVDYVSPTENLSVSVDIYAKKSFDLISSVPADVTVAGGTSLTRNVASLKGNGIDLNIARTHFGGKFTWKTILLLSHNATRIAEVFNARATPALNANSGYTITPLIGEYAYSVISFKSAGLNPITGNARGFLNGQVSEDYQQIIARADWQDLVIHGSGLPLIFGSLRNDFRLGRLSASANISFRLKYFYQRSTIMYGSLAENWIGHQDFKRRWQKPGDENFTTVPAANYPINSRQDGFYSRSSDNVQRADNIRLQDVRLSYDLSNNIKNKSVAIQVFAFLANGGIIWRENKYGEDPDTANLVSIPPTYSFGVKITL